MIKNYISGTKTVVKFLSGAGITHIVSEIIDKNVRQDTLWKKVTVTCAKVVLSDVISISLEKHIDEAVDFIAATIENEAAVIKGIIEKQKEESYSG